MIIIISKNIKDCLSWYKLNINFVIEKKNNKYFFFDWLIYKYNLGIYFILNN